jgi:DnaA-homolog protein
VKQLSLGVRLGEHLRFETFVVGANAAAVADVKRLAAAAGRRGPGGAPGAAAARVVWLAGPLSSGRTHLLHAFCAAVDAHARVGYLDLSVPQMGGSSALSAWHGLAALCLDDVDAVVGDAEAERALFGLYRDYEDRSASLLLAAREVPAALRWQLADIASRFAASSVQRLRALDEAGRASALERHAQARGLQMPDDCTRYLLSRAPRDLRSLIALLDRLDEAAMQAQRRLTVPFIRGVLDSGASAF